MEETEQLVSAGIRVLNIYPETISDGVGIRYAIYLAGCQHHCTGCHNPASWNPQAGDPLTAEMFQRIVNEIRANPLLDGITLSGGDPLYRPEATRLLLKLLKRHTALPVWCYTGYTLEAMEQQPALAACLPYIDVLVDGPFMQALADPTLAFRGSSNQRIIPLANR